MVNLNQDKLFFFNCNCNDFQIHPNSVEHAYLAILDDDLSAAKQIFSGIDSPRGLWGNVLVSILEGFIKTYPTYFQIRNFLEIDLDFLLRNDKIGYVEHVLGASELLSTINQETYKFLARVMFANDLNTAALKYMEKSINIYYNDPELHYMYAKYYLSKRQFREACYYVNECIKLLPDYYPAQILKQRIEEMTI